MNAAKELYEKLGQVNWHKEFAEARTAYHADSKNPELLARLNAYQDAALVGTLDKALVYKLFDLHAANQIELNESELNLLQAEAKSAGIEFSALAPVPTTMKAAVISATPSNINEIAERISENYENVKNILSKAPQQHPEYRQALQAVGDAMDAAAAQGIKTDEALRKHQPYIDACNARDAKLAELQTLFDADHLTDEALSKLAQVEGIKTEDLEKVTHFHNGQQQNHAPIIKTATTVDAVKDETAIHKAEEDAAGHQVKEPVLVENPSSKIEAPEEIIPTVAEKVESEIKRGPHEFKPVVPQRPKTSFFKRRYTEAELKAAAEYTLYKNNTSPEAIEMLTKSFNVAETSISSFQSSMTRIANLISNIAHKQITTEGPYSDLCFVNAYADHQFTPESLNKLAETLDNSREYSDLLSRTRTITHDIHAPALDDAGVIIRRMARIEKAVEKQEKAIQKSETKIAKALIRTDEYNQMPPALNETTAITHEIPKSSFLDTFRTTKQIAERRAMKGPFTVVSNVELAAETTKQAESWIARHPGKLGLGALAVVGLGSWTAKAVKEHRHQQNPDHQVR